MLCHLFLLEHCKHSERSCSVICFCLNIVNTQRDNALSFVSFGTLQTFREIMLCHLFLSEHCEHSER